MTLFVSRDFFWKAIEFAGFTNYDLNYKRDFCQGTGLEAMVVPEKGLSKCALPLLPYLSFDGSTVVEKTNGTRYSIKSENQLLLCENLGLKNGLYLI